MYVLAVSDFLRGLFLILRRDAVHPAVGLRAVGPDHAATTRGWAIVGWMVVILVLPIIGPMIYFALRKPTSHEIDEKYLADRELQRAAARGRSAVRASGPTSACRTRAARPAVLEHELASRSPQGRRPVRKPDGRLGELEVRTSPSSCGSRGSWGFMGAQT